MAHFFCDIDDPYCIHFNIELNDPKSQNMINQPRLYDKSVKSTTTSPPPKVPPNVVPPFKTMPFHLPSSLQRIHNAYH